jgi:uncharacterized membrane protein YjjP (DUF1212 family)
MHETGDAARAFVLRLGRGLHSYGYPAHRLEDALTVVSRRLGLDGQFFSMPTALFASFGSGEQHKTFQIRVDPGEVNLEKLALLDAATGQVARGEVTPDAGSARLDAIFAAPAPYGIALTTLSFALASGAASRFFGGGWREILVSSQIGFAIGLLALVIQRFPAAGRIFEPLAATTAAFLATIAAASAGSLSAYIATVSGLIVLIPGLPLTTAMTELATRHLVSGTTRLAGTCGTFLTIGFGVALGTRLGERLAGEAAAFVPGPLPGWTLWLALGVAPLAFTVLLKAPPEDAPWILGAGAVAFAGARAGGALLGPELGAFVGALAIGLGSNGYSRILGRPAALTLVPGILLLVPGSIGFRSLSSLLERNTVSGVEAAFRMTLVAVSLATGLLFANVLLPERQIESAESR